MTDSAFAVLDSATSRSYGTLCMRIEVKQSARRMGFCNRYVGDGRGAAGPQLSMGGDAAIAAEARHLVDWHARHGFCGVCGAPTVSLQAGYQRKCTNPDCGAEHFPRTDPAVIMLVHRNDMCLLARSRRFAIAGMYSTLAGFVEPGESLEQCLAREVAEEVGVRIGRASYFASQPWPFPHSLMIAFVAEWESGEIRPQAGEIEAATWFEVLQLPKLPSKISIARRLIDAVVAEMREKIKSTN